MREMCPVTGEIQTITSDPVCNHCPHLDENGDCIYGINAGDFIDPDIED